MTQPIWRPYCGAAPTPLDLAARWNVDPVAWIILTILAVLLWRATSARPQQRTAAVSALAVLALIFLSPLCALSSALFSARTVHHVLLIALAAPLLARALPSTRVATPFAAATLLQAAILWGWHLPRAYDAALSSNGIYLLMQVSLLGSATLFWRAFLAAKPWPAAIGQVATLTQMGLLGALITLAPRALYAPHLATTQAWGLSPLQDQQLAGLIMWIPAGGVYLAAAIAAGRSGLGQANGQSPLPQP